MKLKKLFGLLTMTFLCFLFTNASIAFALSGNGTEENPYLIASGDDFKSYSTIVGNDRLRNEIYAKLTCDIDLSNKSRYTKDMKGMLDGDGHKITGAKAPLFNTLYGATIKNLVVESSAITDTNSIGAGAIARSSTDALVIENCTINGSITGQNKTGAVIGCISGEATIRNLIVTADVVTSNSSVDASVGGIVGRVAGEFDVTIENCITMGNVTSEGAFAGGIVGSEENADATSVLNITNVVALQESVSGKANQSGKIYGGGNHTVNITGTNVFAYDSMVCEDNSYSNTNNYKYHGTATVTKTDCKRVSFWNTLFANHTSWVVQGGKIPLLKTTQDALMPEVELAEYLLPVLLINENEVSVENADNGNLLIVASYDGNRLLDVGFVTITADIVEDISELITVESGNVVKAMLWDSMNGMIPLCETAGIDTSAIPATANLTDVYVITLNTATNEYEVYVDTRW